MDDAVWNQAVFSKNRDRQLERRQGSGRKVRAVEVGELCREPSRSLRMTTETIQDDGKRP
jgi:hypothetical protein